MQKEVSTWLQQIEPKIQGCVEIKKLQLTTLKLNFLWAFLTLKQFNPLMWFSQ